jgi:site-specific recombinase XerD
MSNLSTDIKILQDETINNLKSSKSANTLRAYKSDFRDFSLFCIKHELQSIPSNPNTVSIYLTYLSKSEAKMSTLRRRLVSIGAVHKLKGHYLDIKHPIIIENLLGIKRSKGSIQIGKKPILINHLQKIVEVINNDISPEIKKFRDKSLILIGFSGGFRRSEITSLDFEDFEFVEEGLKILVRRSKTDQYGEGHLKGIPYFANSQLCPVRSLKEWINISNIRSGPIFRRFHKGFVLSHQRLSDQSVALLIKSYLNLAGMDSKSYSGHSLRSGFATVTAEAGADERSIMAMTGHKTTEMVRRYIKEANVFKNNALNKVNKLF